MDFEDWRHTLIHRHPDGDLLPWTARRTGFHAMHPQVAHSDPQWIADELPPIP